MPTIGGRGGGGAEWAEPTSGISPETFSTREPELFMGSVAIGIKGVKLHDLLHNLAEPRTTIDLSRTRANSTDTCHNKGLTSIPLVTPEMAAHVWDKQDKDPSQMNYGMIWPHEIFFGPHNPPPLAPLKRH